jgi:hypothetical protein
MKASRILLFLFVATFGIYFLRFISESGNAVKIPPINALKGSVSATSLNYEIEHVLFEAEQSHMLEKDHTRLLTYLISPPAGVILALTTCIGLFNFKKRRPNPIMSRFLRHTATTLCIISLLSVILPAVVCLSIGVFRSNRLLNLIENEDTDPQVVVPGEQVKVHVDYSPLVSSIQQRHEFSSVKVSKLTFNNAVGESGLFELTAQPRDGRRSKGYDDDSSSEWPSLSQGFSRAFPMAGMNDLNVFLNLPNDQRLQGSLVTGSVEGDLDYPIRAGLDEIAVKCLSGCRLPIKLNSRQRQRNCKIGSPMALF